MGEHGIEPSTRWAYEQLITMEGAMKSLIGIAIVSVLLSGCVTKSGRTSGVNYGMSKQEVVAVMGAPVSASTHGSS